MDQQRPVGGQDPASQAIADVLAGRISRRSFIRRWNASFVPDVDVPLQ